MNLFAGDIPKVHLSDDSVQDCSEMTIRECQKSTKCL